MDTNMTLVYDFSQPEDLPRPTLTRSAKYMARNGLFWLTIGAVFAVLAILLDGSNILMGVFAVLATLCLGFSAPYFAEAVFCSCHSMKPSDSYLNYTRIVECDNCRSFSFGGAIDHFRWSYELEVFYDEYDDEIDFNSHGAQKSEL